MVGTYFRTLQKDLILLGVWSQMPCQADERIRERSGPLARVLLDPELSAEGVELWD